MKVGANARPARSRDLDRTGRRAVGVYWGGNQSGLGWSDEMEVIFRSVVGTGKRRASPTFPCWVNANPLLFAQGFFLFRRRKIRGVPLRFSRGGGACLVSKLKKNRVSAASFIRSSAFSTTTRNKEPL
ncbi:unnamed protein product [Amoebophrya sp. A120]|nr:unnamed protein product [Amoebophrya sp. A120]|eukprot:GSA120T00021178001.1